MSPKHISYSIYHPASASAVAANAVTTYQAACRRCWPIGTANTPDSQLLANESHRAVQNFLALLSPKERDILQRHYGISGPPESYVEIGKRYDVSRQRIYEIIKIALNKLHAKLA
jgi:RNA polymerase sigma factor (sigma-70 family)